MKNLRGTLTRSLLAIAVAAVGLALTPVTASAAPLVFEVDETVVPGAIANTFDADKITSSYVEDLTFVGNTFTAVLLVTFNGYDLAGSPQANQVGANSLASEALCPNCYGLYADVTVTGTFTAFVNPADGTQTIFDFDPLTATASVFLNPDQAAGGDDLILTASLIDTLLSDGKVTTLTATGQVIGGTFTVVFTNAVTQGLGLTYWPDFTGLVLKATSTGDVDETSVITAAGGAVTGEASINFEGQQVPEPASLTLLGMGLVGTAFAARRRRRTL